MEDEVAKAIEEKLRDPRLADPRSAYAVAFVDNRAEFDSCYYTVRSDGHYLRGRAADDPSAGQRYRALRVFAETWSRPV